MVAGIYAAINDKSSLDKAADTGATLISQVTPTPQVPPPAPKPAETPVKAAFSPAPAPQPPPPRNDFMPMPTNFVQFPAGLGGERLFDVPLAIERKPDAQPREEGHLAEAAVATAGVPKTEVAFKPSVVAGGKAGPAIRLTYVMVPQLIPCALDTAMDSTIAGAISCHTTQDVLSPEHVLLMPTGTVVMGTYKNDLKVGQNRLFAFTGNAITKEGIPVPLDSSVADSLGRAGIGPPVADVDNHYLERFGAAILLSVAEAGVSLGQAELSRGNTTNLNFGSAGGGGTGLTSLGQQILQSQINIPPTISVPPGSIVSIVVDHPVDFSDAIKVAVR